METKINSFIAAQANIAKTHFLSISRKECLISYSSILDNSNKKWKSSLLLSKNEDYGTALSIAIVSIEELIKALIVIMDGHGFRFRSVKGVKAFFENHEIRYAFAYLLFVMGIFGEDLIQFIDKLRKGEIDLEKYKKDFSGSVDGLISKYKFWKLRRLAVVLKELNMFSRFNSLRQDGLYCGYEEQGVKSPLKISYDDYIEINKRLERVRYITRAIILQLAPHRIKKDSKYLEFILNRCDDKFYNGVSNVLASLKNKRPFELLNKSFDDLLSEE